MKFYCKKKVVNYFKEYIESLMQENDELILFDQNETIDVSLTINDVHIFLSFVPTIKLKIHDALSVHHFFYLNTEQLTRNEMIPFVFTEFEKLKKNIEKLGENAFIGYIDYSAQNIQIVKEKQLFNLIEKQIHCIPYQYNDREIDKLKSFKATYSSKVDFAFSGAMSPYRSNILSQIKSHNKLIIVKGWDEIRDKLISASNVLLNVHYNNNYNIYESIRCDRWIFSEHLVLTENSYLNDTIDLKDLMICANYSDIPAIANNIKQNHTLYESLYFSEKNKLKMKDIIEQRKQAYTVFRQNYTSLK
jgi:hypothetical protein